jgi:hypothetical protein
MTGPSNGATGTTTSATARPQTTKEKSASTETVDKAKKALHELDFIHCNSDNSEKEIEEEVLITALKQIAGELNKWERNKDAAKAIRAIATIWKEGAYDRAGKAIMERVEQQLKETASETEQLQERGKEVLGEIEKAQEKLVAEVSERLASTQAVTQEVIQSQARMYAGATTAGGNGTPLASTQGSQNASPRPSRQLEKMETGERQVLIDFDRNGGLRPPTTPLKEIEWVTKANLAIDNLFVETSQQEERDEEVGEKPRVTAVNLLRNGGIVLEMDSAESATKIRRLAKDFEAGLGVGWLVKNRIWTARAKFIPISTNLDSLGFTDRVCADSGLKTDDITEIRWMKAPERRHDTQTVATIIAKFTSPKAINKAIRDGIVIAGRRFKPELMETEPMRCLNCQLYGHMAADCKNPEACANCGHAHRTEKCTVRNEPDRYRCVNCKVAGHAAWDRNCEEFKRRLDNIRDARTRYKYVVTEEEWTWEKAWETGGEFVNAARLREPPPSRPLARGANEWRDTGPSDGWQNVQRRQWGRQAPQPGPPYQNQQPTAGPSNWNQGNQQLRETTLGNYGFLRGNDNQDRGGRNWGGPQDGNYNGQGPNGEWQ